MDLSAEQFAEILHTMRTSNPGKSDEKRRAQRVEQPSRIDIFPCKESNGHYEPLAANAVMVRNFSSRGIAIINHQEMSLGSQFIIKLKKKNSPSATILCTVVHCDQMRKDIYSIGAEFTCTINEKPAPVTPAKTVDDLARIRHNILD